MLTKKTGLAGGAVVLALLGGMLAATPALAMPPLSQDRDGDGILDHLDTDADNDGISNFAECDGSYAAGQILSGVTEPQLRPSMFGMLPSQHVAGELTADVSSYFGVPAGSVVVTVENATRHPLADVFTVGTNPDRPGGDTRVQINGTLGMYAQLSPDNQWFVDGETKTLTVHDGSTLSDPQAFTGQPVRPGWTRGENVVADGIEYWSKAADPITGRNAQGYVLNPISWVNQIVPSTSSPIGFGLESIVTDFSFGSDVVADGSTTGNNSILWPVMNIMLYPECDTDGDGIGDRLDRPIDGEDDARTTPMNTPIVVDVLANDPTAIQYGDHEVTGVTQPAHGTVVLNADGTTTYTPPTGWTGVTTYTYDVVDALGQTYTQTVTITVPPQGLDDAYTSPFNSGRNLDIQANDPTPGLKLVSVTQPNHGSVMQLADGTVYYWSPTGWSGIATFTYTAEDAFGQTITQNVVVTVLPEGADDFYTTGLNTPVSQDVLPNDPAEELTVVSNTQPSHGTVTLSADGTGTYTPNTGFSGTDTYTYVAENADGQQITQTVTIVVTPLGADDERTTPFETPINIDILENDPTDGLTVQQVSQPDHGATVLEADGTVTYTPPAGFSGTAVFTYVAVDAEGQAVNQTVTALVTPLGENDDRTTPLNTAVVINVLANDPTNGLSVQTITQPSHGVAVINPDGTVTYTPSTGWTGVDTFTYTAVDAEGQEVTQTVTITVLPEGADDVRETPFETPITLNVLTNDPTNDLTVQSITQPPAGTGTASFLPNGDVTYTPAEGFSGVVTFTYTATDPEGNPITQNVMITVTPEGADDVRTTPFETLVVIDVLENDPAVDLTVQSITQPLNGAAVLNADGTVTYTPADGFSGTDMFTYMAIDSIGQPVTQTVTITVTPPVVVEPELPEGRDDVRTTPYETPVNINVLENDPTKPLTVTTITQPSNGTAVVQPDGTITYTPKDGFSGTDTFTYTAVDENGNPVTQTVTVTVEPPVEQPAESEGRDDVRTTPYETPITIDVLDNDPTKPLTVQSITQPEKGTAVLNPDGTVTFTPPAGWHGTTTFTYTAVDENGKTVVQTVTVTVEPPVIVPELPKGEDDVRETPYEEPITIDVLDNDPSKDGLTVTSITQPGHGTAVLNPDGTVTYTPDKGWSGTDTFSYTAVDEHGNEITQTITVTVKPPATTPKPTDPPVKEQPGKTPPKGAVTGDPLAEQDGSGLAAGGLLALIGAAGAALLLLLRKRRAEEG